MFYLVVCGRMGAHRAKETSLTQHFYDIIFFVPFLCGTPILSGYVFYCFLCNFTSTSYSMFSFWFYFAQDFAQIVNVCQCSWKLQLYRDSSLNLIRILSWIYSSSGSPYKCLHCLPFSVTLMKLCKLLNIKFFQSLLLNSEAVTATTDNKVIVP